jgi:predicted transcriptional regulator
LHGFSYISFILHADPNLKLEFKNLSHYKSAINLDYLSILESQGITFQDIKSSSETSNFKIHLENSKYPLYFNFHKGETAVLVSVSRSHRTENVSIMQHIIDDFDMIVHEVLDEINNTGKENQKNHPDEKTQVNADSKEDLAKNLNNSGNLLPKFETKLKIFPKSMLDKIFQETEKILTIYLSEYLLPEFMIPQKILSEDSPELFSDSTSDISLDFYNEIDNSLTIEEHISIFKIDLSQIRGKMFNLWFHKALEFRLKFYEWDRFHQTVKAPLYLKDGLKENLALIQTFNTSKIVKILDIIGNDTSYHSLFQSSNLTKTKLNKYLSELFNLGLIRKVPYSPKMDHVSEDLIPLLTMQGFTKKDFRILQKLEDQLNGKKTLDDVAIELAINPARIKSLLDKYKNVIRVLI